tara:strand:+ start:20929 stop:21705 length:777 start_codon:yes stop_codon:yes gene_type:complete
MKLPLIMVAPNGARRGKADHPALPVTIAETVETAKACFDAGARGIHAHVRDENGAHVLDAGLYVELIAQMENHVPDMAVQITTEAVGLYAPASQRQLVRDVMPNAVSIALREMLPDDDELDAVRTFYHWADEAEIAVQHILYTPKDVADLLEYVRRGIVPNSDLQLLFVLGRYAKDQQSQVKDMDPFLDVLTTRGKSPEKIQWALCAFGRNETDCLAEAVRRGGKARIGFENSLWNRDGALAADNAERVRELSAAIGA